MSPVLYTAAQSARAGWSRFCQSLCIVVLMLGVAGTLAPARAGDAASPEAAVAQFDDALLKAMKSGRQLGYQGRYDTLAATMDATFDFEAMTRTAIGPRWVGLTPGDQRSLIDAFKRFSIATYADQFDSYSGEKFEITGKSNPPQGVLVATTMTPAKGDPVRFSYLMHQVGGEWRVIDIYVDGTISQLAVRRSEFAAVLTKAGPDGLRRLLDERTEKLAMM
jgi:phospholipid transport system substrate-binding protein